MYLQFACAITVAIFDNFVLITLPCSFLSDFLPGISDHEAVLVKNCTVISIIALLKENFIYLWNRVNFDSFT